MNEEQFAEVIVRAVKQATKQLHERVQALETRNISLHVRLTAIETATAALMRESQE